MPLPLEGKVWSGAVLLLTGGMYVSCSAGLIAFNKKIMAADQFPYSAGLGLLHASFCSVAAVVLFVVHPSLFPSLTDPEKRVDVDRSLFVRAILPIALCFSVQIILSNMAYIFADIAFLQMLKETNVVSVYLLSVLCAVEAFGWRQLRLISLIMIATTCTIRGELHFTLPGFLLQLSSCLAEATKITLQGVLLTSAGKGLDALSYMLLVMPACALTFGCVLFFCTYVVPNQQILGIPSFADWVNMRWMLLGNAFLALALNFSALLFIKCSSAVSYVLAGIVKDVMIVGTGVVFMGHEISALQAGGFSMQVSLIFTWSLLKTFPNEFTYGFIDGFRRIFSARKVETPPIAEQCSDDYGAIKDADRQPNAAAPEKGTV